MLEHTPSDRWIIQGLNAEVENRGYDAYSILHVNFGSTGKEFCNFKVIMNSENVIDENDSSREVGEKVFILISCEL
jgi:hypothetical protein